MFVFICILVRRTINFHTHLQRQISFFFFITFLRTKRSFFAYFLRCDAKLRSKKKLGIRYGCGARSVAMAVDKQMTIAQYFNINDTAMQRSIITDSGFGFLLANNCIELISIAAIIIVCKKKTYTHPPKK